MATVVILVLSLLAVFLKASFALPIGDPEGSQLGNDSHIIEVYNNYTIVFPVPFNRTNCLDDIRQCANQFQLTAPGYDVSCKARVICCPLDHFKNTIPQYIPILTRPDVSDNGLSDYSRCKCKPTTYTMMYLERDESNHSWLARKTEVDVGYQCDWSIPHCEQFMC